MPPMTDLRATYRLQLTDSFGFADAAALVDYLADLGVSHLYLSPLLQARPGSAHGYDVADPTRVSETLGGEDALRALAARARERGLGIVVDIVPNHLGTGAATPLWETVLAEGQPGPAGHVFDVDWDPALPGAAGKVVVPVLGDQYGAVLQRGELQVVDEDAGGVRLRYFDNTFPLSPESLEALQRSAGVDAFAGKPGHRETWQRLHALLEAQHYRLVHWRVGDAVLNYRRFFTINELAAVRVEDEDVFETTHGCVLALVADGVIEGLRIDHPDGLRDPRRYLERLAARSGGVWTVVEKILEPGEELPGEWPVAGTTGYEFANDVLGLFVDPAAAPVLDELDREFGADAAPYQARAVAAKHEIMETGLAADVERLSRRLWHVAQAHVEARDVDLATCRRVLTRTVAALHVYRTYVDPQTGDARAVDVERVQAAVAQAGGGGEPDAALAVVLGRVLCGQATEQAELDLLARVQQLSGAVMAKGVEDTIFYRYRRLLAVNEVGADPSTLGLDVTGFHARNAARPATGMVTTATHDTKRGEDVRLRMAAISELSDRWAAAVRQWRDWNGPLVGAGPDPQTEYLIYQTLVGVWPLDPAADLHGDVVDRLLAYVVKACREAGERTSWTDPDAAFEDGVEAFLRGALDAERAPRFLGGMAAFAGDCAEIAFVSGLAQTLLRVTSPGVPDTYQGMELWDDSLVDPDNRRAVDYAQRRRALRELADADPGQLWAQRDDGRVKLWVLSQALHARASGGYDPLRAAGRSVEHVVAFARGDDLVAVAPRLPGAVMGPDLAPPTGERWADTTLTLPGGRWSDLLGGPGEHAEEVAVGDVLSTLPVALLRRR
jgi:(1->4)-alpha-D-glucan 1-alpha-D-glucosylmutase